MVAPILHPLLPKYNPLGFTGKPGAHQMAMAIRTGSGSHGVLFSLYLPTLTLYLSSIETSFEAFEVTGLHVFGLNKIYSRQNKDTVSYCVLINNLSELS